VSCSAASAITSARDDIAKTKNNFFIRLPLLSPTLVSADAKTDIFLNAIGYAKSYSRSHDAVIRVYDEAGNVIVQSACMCSENGNARAPTGFLKFL
jgi:hypothetical protein